VKPSCALKVRSVLWLLVFGTAVRVWYCMVYGTDIRLFGCGPCIGSVVVRRKKWYKLRVLDYCMAQYIVCF
jgi:hypothetical protein